MNSSFFEAVFCLNQMSMEIVGRGIVAIAAVGR